MQGIVKFPRVVIDWVVYLVWMVVVLLWPLIKWISSIYVFWLFARMLFLWSEPGLSVGLNFSLGFAALVALNYFVSIYRPKKSR